MKFTDMFRPIPMEIDERLRYRIGLIFSENRHFLLRFGAVFGGFLVNF